MKISHLHMLAAVFLATFATPAFAQSEDNQWEGAYIGGTIGVPAQKNDNGETVLFDTNRDGTFGDTVRTTTGADAFSPDFRRSDRDFDMHNLRLTASYRF